MSAENPKDLKYSKEHEWARVKGGSAVVGITHFAQDSLGDIVYVSLPDVGSDVKQFQKMGEVESVKAVSDLFSPVSGKVVERNEDILRNPETLNREPFGSGWMIKVQLSNPAEVDKLMDSDAYDRHTADGH